MKIAKTTMTFTFLHPADEPVDGMDPEHILRECDDGGFVGSWGAQPMTTVELAPEAVEDELLALGNDGEFFTYFQNEEDPS